MKKKIITLICIVSIFLSVFTLRATAVMQSYGIIISTGTYAYSGQAFTAKDFKDMLKNDELGYLLVKDSVVVTTAEGEPLDDSSWIPTGALLSFEFMHIDHIEKWERTYILMGDVNCDGRITAVDAQHALRISSRLENADSFIVRMACDVDADYKITAADARLILRASAQLEDPGQFIVSRGKVIDKIARVVDGKLTILLKPGYTSPQNEYPPEMFSAELVSHTELRPWPGSSGEIVVYLFMAKPGVDNIDRLLLMLYELPFFDRFIFPAGSLLH